MTLNLYQFSVLLHAKNGQIFRGSAPKLVTPRLRRAFGAPPRGPLASELRSDAAFYYDRNIILYFA
jgi:hypothetical protein